MTAAAIVDVNLIVHNSALTVGLGYRIRAVADLAVASPDGH